MSEEKKDYTRIIKRARRRRKTGKLSAYCRNCRDFCSFWFLCVFIFVEKKADFRLPPVSPEGVAIATDSDAEARGEEAAETTAGDAGDQGRFTSRKQKSRLW